MSNVITLPIKRRPGAKAKPAPLTHGQLLTRARSLGRELRRAEKATGEFRYMLIEVLIGHIVKELHRMAKPKEPISTSDDLDFVIALF
jgi:hypothetical protein